MSVLLNLRRRMTSALGFHESATLATIGITFGACCSNVVYLEHLVKMDPNCTSLITFAQFAFIAVEKFFSETRCFTKRRTVPIARYLEMVVVFFATSWLNNYALSYDIPMPLHMIFKSASLLSNMVLGIFILKKSYSFRKYCAVLMITIGITLCTLAGRKDSDLGSVVPSFTLTQVLGIGILIIALLLSSLMGILQERLSRDYGKHPGEMMFYIHALALPAFALFTPQMVTSFKFLQDTPKTFGISSGILYLIINVVTQYICISSVFRLSAECTSLTVTLVLTLRKFISLIISVFYFKNSFTRSHWMGTAFVFFGTFLFMDMSKSKIKHQSEDDKAGGDDSTSPLLDSDASESKKEQ